jgi:hypothetical protein
MLFGPELVVGVFVPTWDSLSLSGSGFLPQGWVLVPNW